jgi:hypothetical protein
MNSEIMDFLRVVFEEELLARKDRTGKVRFRFRADLEDGI